MKTAALAALLLAAAPTQAAVRNYSVTSFDRIRIDGPYQVSLKTGVAPFARATGAQASLDGVSVKVEGRTLVVRSDTSAGWGGYPGEGRGPVTIELGTHDLGTVWINGAGGLNIDKVKGLMFDIAVQGSGSLRIDAADIDQMRIGLSGSASTHLAGRAAKLSATVRGTSTLDAQSLSVKDALLGAEGPVTVRAKISGTAKVDALGLASVAIDGSPSCEVKSEGSASVTGCR
jgi:hypothetical protein